MNNVWYLAIVVGLSAVGVLFVWLRSRPSATRSSIDQFQDKMNALSPDAAVRSGQPSERDRHRRSRNGRTSEMS